MLGDTLCALQSVPVARRLQLNHPLNYLIVPLLRAAEPERPLLALLETYWPDLKKESTRRFAVDGARSLGLLDMEDELTPSGVTVADLLVSVGFEVGARVSKRARLADAHPAVAAVARSVLLQQSAVRFVFRVLQQGARSAKGLSMGELIVRARGVDEVLAGALFLRNPDKITAPRLEPADFAPSTFFKLKQVLWHAGVLASPASAAASGGTRIYDPTADHWELAPRMQSASGGT